MSFPKDNFLRIHAFWKPHSNVVDFKQISSVLVKFREWQSIWRLGFKFLYCPLICFFRVKSKQPLRLFNLTFLYDVLYR
jgi:hypothetical protein